MLPEIAFENIDIDFILRNNIVAPLFDTDSYKTSHWLMLPDNTTKTFSYIEARGGAYDRVMFAGLQYVIKKFFTIQITKRDVEQAYILYTLHGVPFNMDGWMRIVDKHNGRIPVRIRALKEGTLVPTQTVLVTVESTDPELPWITTWVETCLLRVWYPITVATLSYHIKQDVNAALELTCDDPAGVIPFRLHDFGARGVSTQEGGGIGGLAHLVNFMGTDTVMSLLYTLKYYKAASMPAFSIPATEHSVTCAWGREGEADFYANVIRRYGKPGTIFACVSDTYDLKNAVRNIWGEKLRQQVIDSGAIVVIRPDSGDPVTMVCETLTDLAEKFGYTINKKGFKVLKHVRVIQGDGINHPMIKKIIAAVIALGFSLENVAFGMGGALLQGLTRDTQQFAMKGSWVMVDGQGRSIRKDPVTDSGKRSKAGRLDVIQRHVWSDRDPHDNRLQTVVLDEGQDVHPDSVMQVVYENGVLYNETTIEEIRARAA